MKNVHRGYSKQMDMQVCRECYGLGSSYYEKTVNGKTVLKECECPFCKGYGYIDEELIKYIEQDIRRTGDYINV